MKKRRHYTPANRDEIKIYGIKELGSNTIFYVGKTEKHPEIRLKEHLRKNKDPENCVNINLYNKFESIKKRDSGCIPVVLATLTQGRFEKYSDFKKRFFETEQMFIKIYNPSCNINGVKKKGKRSVKSSRSKIQR